MIQWYKINNIVNIVNIMAKVITFIGVRKLLHIKFTHVLPSIHQVVTVQLLCQQELSYCKQIASQLRTRYVEGTHRPKYYTVTLKSRLRVTQGHWKRNHWTDHTTYY